METKIHHIKTDRKAIKKVAAILLGNCIYAAGVVFFILPTGLISGGTTGLAIFVNHYTGLPINQFVMIFNIVMFVAGALILGKKFAMTTLLSTFFYPIALSILQEAARYTGVPTTNEMLCTVFAGALIGLGIAMVIQAGASTGGMDIPPLVVNKMTGISVALLLYAFDVIILLLQMIFTDSEKVLYGILLVCIYSFILEKYLVMGKSRVQIMIISKKYIQINELILKKFDRGTTLFEVEGGYTRDETYAVLTVVGHREVFQINEAIKVIDPEAFLIIGEVKEVRGHGFTSRKIYSEASDER